MEYRILKSFLIVAREELNVQLFIRGQRKITLTEAGLLLRRRAQEIVELMEKTENEINGNNTIEGIIAIGIGESKAMKFLSKVMNQFHELYPNIQFDIFSSNATYIQERLEKGLLDIGVLLAPSNLEKYEYIRFNDEEQWGIIVNANSNLAKKKNVVAKDLIGYNILTSKRDIEQGVAHWFGKTYDQLDIFGSFNLLYNAAIFVEQTDAVAFTIEGAFSLYQNPNLVFVPFSPSLKVSSVCVWKKYQPMSLAVKKFIDFLQCNIVMENNKK